MPRQSLVDFLNEIRRLGNTCAIVQRTGYRTSRSSYIEVASLAAQCAREFELRGIQRGDRILLWGRNSAEWVAVFFGCILCGAVAVPMDQGATESFASRVAAQVDAKLIVMDRGNAPSSEQRPTILFDSLKEVVGKHSSEPYPSPPLNADPSPKSSLRQAQLLSQEASLFRTEIFLPTSNHLKKACSRT